MKVYRYNENGDTMTVKVTIFGPDTEGKNFIMTRKKNQLVTVKLNHENFIEGPAMKRDVSNSKYTLGYFNKNCHWINGKLDVKPNNDSLKITATYREADYHGKEIKRFKFSGLQWNNNTGIIIDEVHRNSIDSSIIAWPVDDFDVDNHNFSRQSSVRKSNEKYSTGGFISSETRNSGGFIVPETRISIQEQTTFNTSPSVTYPPIINPPVPTTRTSIPSMEVVPRVQSPYCTVTSYKQYDTSNNTDILSKLEIIHAKIEKLNENVGAIQNKIAQKDDTLDSISSISNKSSLTSPQSEMSDRVQKGAQGFSGGFVVPGSVGTKSEIQPEYPKEAVDGLPHARYEMPRKRSLDECPRITDLIAQLYASKESNLTSYPEVNGSTIRTANRTSRPSIGLTHEISVRAAPNQNQNNFNGTQKRSTSLPSNRTGLDTIRPVTIIAKKVDNQNNLMQTKVPQKQQHSINHTPNLKQTLNNINITYPNTNVNDQPNAVSSLIHKFSNINKNKHDNFATPFVSRSSYDDYDEEIPVPMPIQDIAYVRSESLPRQRGANPQNQYPKELGWKSGRNSRFDSYRSQEQNYFNPHIRQNRTASVDNALDNNIMNKQVVIRSNQNLGNNNYQRGGNAYPKVTDKFYNNQHYEEYYQPANNFIAKQSNQHPYQSARSSLRPTMPRWEAETDSEINMRMPRRENIQLQQSAPSLNHPGVQPPYHRDQMVNIYQKNPRYSRVNNNNMPRSRSEPRLEQTPISNRAKANYVLRDNDYPTAQSDSRNYPWSSNNISNNISSNYFSVPRTSSVPRSYNDPVLNDIPKAAPRYNTNRTASLPRENQNMQSYNYAPELSRNNLDPRLGIVVGKNPGTINGPGNYNSRNNPAPGNFYNESRSRSLPRNYGDTRTHGNYVAPESATTRNSGNYNGYRNNSNANKQPRTINNIGGNKIDKDTVYIVSQYNMKNKQGTLEIQAPDTESREMINQALHKKARNYPPTISEVFDVVKTLPYVKQSPGPSMQSIRDEYDY